MTILKYKKRFYQLMESQMGDIKPIICEQDDIDLEKTYLSKEKISKRKEDIQSGNRPKQPRVVDLTGKVFKDEEFTTSEDYISGLHFNEISNGTYDVNFSSEFISKYFSIPLSKVYNATSLYGNEHGDQPVPLIIKIGDEEYGIEQLLTGIRINTEGFPTNRIHFPGGISESLQGTGLGYLIYQQFIKYLGWGSSKPNASSKAQVVWSKLAKDPDFYSFVVNKDNNDESVFVISKTNSFYEPKEIVLFILDNLYRNKSTKFDVVLGSELKNDFPEIDKMFSSPEESLIKFYMSSLKLRIESLLNRTDDRIEKIQNEFPKEIEEYANKINDTVQEDIDDPISRVAGRTPYITSKSIYNEVKDLFDRYVKKFIDPSTVDFKEGYSNADWWKLNSHYKKYEETETFNYINFNTTISNINKFFHNYFKLLNRVID